MFGVVTLTYRTAGESHGPALFALVEGLPAGLVLTRDDIDRDLARRQLGYGRGGRMKIETDRVEVRAGLRHGRTIGSPLMMEIANREQGEREAAEAAAQGEPQYGERIDTTKKPRTPKKASE